MEVELKGGPQKHLKQKKWSRYTGVFLLFKSSLDTLGE